MFAVAVAVAVAVTAHPRTLNYDTRSCFPHFLYTLQDMCLWLAAAAREDQHDVCPVGAQGFFSARRP
jgi:hypothetical protein